MKTLFLSVAAAAALAVSAGSASAQYNAAQPAPAPTIIPVQAYPAPSGYAAGPTTGGCDASGCGHGHLGFLHGHMGHLHGHLGSLHGHSGGWFTGKLHGWFGGGGGIFCNHGHLFGKGHGGGGLFSGLSGGGMIQPVDPRSGNAGQLVFPQHPFIRGPRDYFMMEDR